jgi:phosphoribosyl-ATP pyrophosphohydrolase/phosphoribosyl-AMP cyclohydrolase
MKPDFTKSDGLLPVIIQDSVDLRVLMLGYMNEAAFVKTVNERKVTFYSRSKERLWTKGEASRNILSVDSMHLDCDRDTLLILATPSGPTCHTGEISCFKSTNYSFLLSLERIISAKVEQNESNSYTSKLFKRGINKIAQKVGEEAIELVIEAKDDDMQLFLNEGADLLYHLLVLLKAKNVTLKDIELILEQRNK